MTVDEISVLKGKIEHRSGFNRINVPFYYTERCSVFQEKNKIGNKNGSEKWK
jgi:hypothetical protein